MHMLCHQLGKLVLTNACSLRPPVSCKLDFAPPWHTLNTAMNAHKVGVTLAQIL